MFFKDVLRVLTLVLKTEGPITFNWQRLLKAKFLKRKGSKGSGSLCLWKFNHLFTKPLKIAFTVRGPVLTRADPAGSSCAQKQKAAQVGGHFVPLCCQVLGDLASHRGSRFGRSLVALRPDPAAGTRSWWGPRLQIQEQVSVLPLLGCSECFPFYSESVRM